MSELAIFGGTPVYRGTWPRWPRYSEQTLRRLEEVLSSRRWAVSGDWTGRSTMDEDLSARIAQFVGCRFAVPTDHGSTALVAALLALGVGFGKEVVVPGLTWVACATAVLRVNAVPVLVDIEPETLCIAPRAVEAAITHRTAAIVVVHLYSAMANMDALREISAHHGIPLIEDAAQAHGAEWSGQRAGSLGDIGTFSMQQGKALTSGEGGAAVTSNAVLANRLEQIRGDGRCYRRAPGTVGHPQLVEVGDVQGFNFHLSEVQAALLIDGLERLETENRIRAANAAALTAGLAAIPGLGAIRPHANNNLRAYYQYPVMFESESFGGCRVEQMCAALEAELGFWVHPPYRPLDAHALYVPHRSASLAPQLRSSVLARSHPLTEAHRQASRVVLFHHSALLGEEAHTTAIVEAFAKVSQHRRELARIEVGGD